MDGRRGNPSLPKNSSKNLLYRNPLHVPAPAYLRQARLNSLLTHKPPEPNVIHQPQHYKYRHRDGPARTHQR
jgi:hypothetical protein